MFPQTGTRAARGDYRGAQRCPQVLLPDEHLLLRTCRARGLSAPAEPLGCPAFCLTKLFSDWPMLFRTWFRASASCR